MYKNILTKRPNKFYYQMLLVFAYLHVTLYDFSMHDNVKLCVFTTRHKMSLADQDFTIFHIKCELKLRKRGQERV